MVCGTVAYPAYLLSTAAAELVGRLNASRCMPVQPSPQAADAGGHVPGAGTGPSAIARDFPFRQLNVGNATVVIEPTKPHAVRAGPDCLHAASWREYNCEGSNNDSTGQIKTHRALDSVVGEVEVANWWADHYAGRWADWASNVYALSPIARTDYDDSKSCEYCGRQGTAYRRVFL